MPTSETRRTRNCCVVSGVATLFLLVSSSAQASKFTKVRDRYLKPVAEFVKNPTLDNGAKVLAAPVRGTLAAGDAALELLNEGVDHSPTLQKVLRNGVEISMPIGSGTSSPGVEPAKTTPLGGDSTIDKASPGVELAKGSPLGSVAFSISASQAEKKFFVRMVPVAVSQQGMSATRAQKASFVPNTAKPDLQNQPMVKRQVKIDAEMAAKVDFLSPATGPVTPISFEPKEIAVFDAGKLIGHKRIKKFFKVIAKHVMEEITGTLAECAVDVVEETFVSLVNHKCVAWRAIPGCAALSLPAGLGGLGTVGLSEACPQICDKWQDVRHKKKTYSLIFQECVFDFPAAY